MVIRLASIFVFVIVLVSGCLSLEESVEGAPHVERHTGHRNAKDIISGQRDFFATDYLLDGERERRLHFGGITAKETSTGESGVSLRQVTDGQHFIQMIFSSEAVLVDCEYIRQKKIVENFLESFQRDIEKARYSDRLNNSDADVNTRKISKDQFEEFLENDILTSEDMDFNMNFQREGLKNITFQLLDSVDDLPADIKGWLNYPALREECKTKHQEIKRIIRHREHGSEAQKQSAEEHLERSRRSVSDMFIMPGTKWCGKGHSAGRYVELGGLASVDHCCRRHDHCPGIVKGLQTKYNYFNFTPFTVSHCNCDFRFRTCLKLVDSTAANMVGKLFFNVVQSKCFIFKKEKNCASESWWGKCTKYTYKKRAVLRNNMLY